MKYDDNDNFGRNKLKHVDGLLIDVACLSFFSLYLEIYSDIYLFQCCNTTSWAKKKHPLLGLDELQTTKQTSRKINRRFSIKQKDLSYQCLESSVVFFFFNLENSKLSFLTY